MSDPQNLNGGTYTAMETVAQVNSVPDYKTLGNYYTTRCPFQTMPGDVPVQCVTITPVFGGVGYSVLQNNLPATQLNDAGYFSMTNAYPYYPSTACMKPFNG